jgi:hypothetical protein
VARDQSIIEGCHLLDAASRSSPPSRRRFLARVRTYSKPSRARREQNAPASTHPSAKSNRDSGRVLNRHICLRLVYQIALTTPLYVPIQLSPLGPTEDSQIDDAPLERGSCTAFGRLPSPSASKATAVARAHEPRASVSTHDVHRNLGTSQPQLAGVLKSGIVVGARNGITNPGVLFISCQPSPRRVLSA